MNMKLAVMQPYLFPYIGYYQLIASVDKFVIYDDVSYIKQGWINRNNILNNHKPVLFTVPLNDASSFRRICDTELNTKQYSPWKEKFLRSLELNYRRAPFFVQTHELVCNVLNAGDNDISQLASRSLKVLCKYLNVSTEIVGTSAKYNNNDLRSQERILDICKQEGATTYINAPGGQGLYSFSDFNEKGVKLQFIKPGNIIYKQFAEKFVPSLSMIDVLMFNSKEEATILLNQYELS